MKPPLGAALAVAVLAAPASSRSSYGTWNTALVHVSQKLGGEITYKRVRIPYPQRDVCLDQTAATS